MRKRQILRKRNIEDLSSSNVVSYKEIKAACEKGLGSDSRKPYYLFSSEYYIPLNREELAKFYLKECVTNKKELTYLDIEDIPWILTGKMRQAHGSCVFGTVLLEDTSSNLWYDYKNKEAYLIDAKDFKIKELQNNKVVVIIL